MPDKKGILTDEGILTINAYLDAIGCDRAYKKDMKATYEKDKPLLKAQVEACLAHLASRTDEGLMLSDAEMLDITQFATAPPDHSIIVARYRKIAQAQIARVKRVYQARQEKAVEQARENERDIAQNRINQIVDANNKALNIVEEQARQQEREAIFEWLIDLWQVVRPGDRKYISFKVPQEEWANRKTAPAEWQQALKGRAPKGEEE